jgi:hypothetical protein
MSPVELDRRFREIAARVTPETILSETRALVELGIGPRAAFLILAKILEPR